MSDRGGRFYVHDYSDDRGPQELSNATLIGVELDNGATVELGLRRGHVELRSDDQIAIYPNCANTVEVHPTRDHVRPSRIEKALDQDEDRATARHALNAACALANSLRHADATKRAADRELIMTELRAYLEKIRRAL